MKFLVEIRLSANIRSGYSIKRVIIAAESHSHAYRIASGKYQERGIVLSTESGKLYKL